MTGLALAFLFALPAAAEIRAGGALELFDVLGWNKGCSVAVRHLRYPAVTEGLSSEPSWGRIGVVHLPPDEMRVRQEWSLEAGGRVDWDVKQADATMLQLQRSGYSGKGYLEEVRPDPAAASRPDLDPVIRSTGSLGVVYPVDWPRAPFRLARVHYSELGTCALVVFERMGAKWDVHRYLLVRVPHESRRRRATAHLENALLLYRSESDLYGAVEEAGIAAAMDPRLTEARFQYAVLLAAHGRFDESLKELRAAVDQEAGYAKLAKDALEFEDLRKDSRFRAIIKPPKTE